VDGLTDEILTQLGQLNPDRLGVVKYGLPATRATSQGEWRGPPAISPNGKTGWRGVFRRNNDKVRVFRPSDSCKRWDGAVGKFL